MVEDHSGLLHQWSYQKRMVRAKSFYYWQRVIQKETLAKCPLPSSDVQTTFVELPSPKLPAEVPMNEPAAIIHYMQKVENKKQLDML